MPIGLLSSRYLPLPFAIRQQPLGSNGLCLLLCIFVRPQPPKTVKELLKKLRNYEIRIRKAVQGQMQGDFHSVFKGSGLEFDDVRQYQYGDDVRHIDWNVSAKGHGTFIKTFREEKEQQVFFLLDVSASQEIGLPDRQKLTVAKEICGVLALSAIKEGSSIGLLCFSDQKERYLRPDKGIRHAHAIIHAIFELRPQSGQTHLSKAIQSALSLLRRRSVVIVLSDFVDDQYERPLKALAQAHDLIVIHLSDRREAHFPDLGIIPLQDKESGLTRWVNSSSEAFRRLMEERLGARTTNLSQLCSQAKANFLDISTEDDFVPKLIRLFRIRNASR